MLCRKDAICDNGKIVSIAKEVWISLSEDLDKELKPISLHFLITNIRYTLKDKFLGTGNVCTKLSEIDEAFNKTTESLNSSSPRDFFAFDNGDLGI